MCLKMNRKQVKTKKEDEELEEKEHNMCGMTYTRDIIFTPFIRRYTERLLNFPKVTQVVELRFESPGSDSRVHILDDSVMPLFYQLGKGCFAVL